MAKLTTGKRKKAPRVAERESDPPNTEETAEANDQKELDKTPAKKLYPNQK